MDAEGPRERINSEPSVGQQSFILFYRNLSLQALEKLIGHHPAEHVA